ncbi:MAG: hypothetical protein ACREU7_01195 [Burkholderiales bacterium]
MARHRSRSTWKIPPAGGKGRRRLVRFLKLAWWSACLGVIVWWFVSVDPGAVGSRVNEPLPQQTLRGVMALLAFPAGLIWVWSMPWLAPAVEALGIPLEGWPWYAPSLLVWSGCALLGYVQWFWLLPHVFTLRASDS